MFNSQNEEKFTSENVSEVFTEQTASGAGAQEAWKAIVFGGLTVGVLDCLAATLNAARSGVSFSSILIGIFIHIFIVGLPAALIVRRFSQK